MNITEVVNQLARPGIYAIRFKKAREAYVGQSHNLGARVFSHAGGSEIAAVREHGEAPEWFALEFCPAAELAQAECLWFRRHQQAGWKMLNSYTFENRVVILDGAGQAMLRNAPRARSWKQRSTPKWKRVSTALA
jgi:hypothetical protein